MERERYHTVQIVTVCDIFGFEDQAQQFVERFEAEVRLQFKDAVVKVERTQFVPVHNHARSGQPLFTPPGTCPGCDYDVEHEVGWRKGAVPAPYPSNPFSNGDASAAR